MLAKAGSLICLQIKKKKNNDEKSNLQCYISRYIFQDVLKKKKTPTVLPSVFKIHHYTAASR